MIPGPSLTPLRSRQQNRWLSLTEKERIEEFRELAESPYWKFLPDEIQLEIRNLMARNTLR